MHNIRRVIEALAALYGMAQPRVERFGATTMLARHFAQFPFPDRIADTDVHEQTTPFSVSVSNANHSQHQVKKLRVRLVVIRGR
ncbi:MAG: hypothetical protein U1E68_09760 [Sphingomonadaceae bacterium]|jgi:hypothetical protein